MYAQYTWIRQGAFQLLNLKTRDGSFACFIATTLEWIDAICQGSRHKVLPHLILGFYFFNIEVTSLGSISRLYILINLLIEGMLIVDVFKWVIFDCHSQYWQRRSDGRRQLAQCSLFKVKLHLCALL